MITIYAFWQYDRFPFLLGGEICPDRSENSKDGHVYVPSYQGWIKPAQLIIGEAGRILLDDLNQLEEEHREAELRLKETFRCKLVVRLNTAGITHPAAHVRHSIRKAT